MEQESDEVICRICLDNDHIEDLFSPCKCKGTSKFVHKKCLITWINENLDNQHSKICNQCQYEYEFSKKNKNNKCFNFCYFITHYKFVSFLINFGILSLLGFIFTKTNFYTYLNKNFLNFAQYQTFSFLILGSFIYLLFTTCFLALIFLLFFLGILDVDWQIEYYELNFKKIFLAHMWGMLLFYFFPMVSFTVTIFIIGIDRLYLYEKINYYLHGNEKYEILEYQEEDDNSVANDLETGNLINNLESDNLINENN